MEGRHKSRNDTFSSILHAHDPRADMLRWDRPSTDDERLTMIREPRTDLSVRPEKD
jgi:hypothetical protein